MSNISRTYLLHLSLVVFSTKIGKIDLKNGLFVNCCTISPTPGSIFLWELEQISSIMYKTSWVMSISLSHVPFES